MRVTLSLVRADGMLKGRHPCAVRALATETCCQPFELKANSCVFYESLLVSKKNHTFAAIFI